MTGVPAGTIGNYRLGASGVTLLSWGLPEGPSYKVKRIRSGTMDTACIAPMK